MIHLKRRNPAAAAYLENGGFSGSLTGNSHSNIPMDQIMETTINRFSKSTGGVVGKTEDPGACEKWARINHYLCALKEHMHKKVGKNRNFQHIELGKRRMEKDKTDVEAIVCIFKTWVPNIYSDTQPLINISKGSPATPQLLKNVKYMYSRGKTARDLFFLRITTTNGAQYKKTYRHKIDREPQLTFADKKKPDKKNIDCRR